MLQNKPPPQRKRLLIIGAGALVSTVLLLAINPIRETLCKPDQSTLEQPTESVVRETAPSETFASEELMTSPTEMLNFQEPATIPPVDETVLQELPHEHEYAVIVTPATCETGEITRYICNCDDTYEETTASAVGHNYSKKTVAATVDTQGYDIYTCTRCANSYKTNYKDKIVKHVHNHVPTIIPATCEKDGYIEYLCACGDFYKEVNVTAPGHDLQEIKNDVPDCQLTEITYQCSNCDYSETKEVEPAAHTFALSRSFDEGENEEAGGEANETAVYSAIATGQAKCAKCGDFTALYVEGSETFHNMGEWQNSGPLFHMRSCESPGCMYVEATKHTYAQTEKIPATCTMGTHFTWACLWCGRVSINAVANDALGHAFVFTKTIASTTTSPGYELWSCTRCNETEKRNYNFVGEHTCEWKEQYYPATCLDPDYTVRTCSICFKTETINVGSKLLHDHRPMITPPTCTTSGGKVMKCSRCDDSYVVESWPAAGHNHQLSNSEIATNAWAGYEEYTCTRCGDSYRNTIPQLAASAYPKGYRDNTCTIIVYKEWYENAYVYAAHVRFTDYTRLWVECAKGKYNSGTETTSNAAKRVGAILAINGDYATPGNGASSYAIARKGVVCNDKKTYPEGVYNSNTGMLLYGQSKGISGQQLSELVSTGLVTDTFQFAPVCLLNGVVQGDSSSTSRAQRTFIGTNGHPGDIWLCVSDGRSNDGKSSGLNGYQCGAYLKSKGCTLGVPLDGGGSSTIYFNGQVLNAARNGQRAVADFVMFK